MRRRRRLDQRIVKVRIAASEVDALRDHRGVATDVII